MYGKSKVKGNIKENNKKIINAILGLDLKFIKENLSKKTSRYDSSSAREIN